MECGNIHKIDIDFERFLTKDFQMEQGDGEDPSIEQAINIHKLLCE